MVERIMFQFTLHLHTIENVTVLYLTGFRAETLVGRLPERSVGPIDRSPTILASRQVERTLTRLLKIKKKRKKKKERNGPPRGTEGRRALAQI